MSRSAASEAFPIPLSQLKRPPVSDGYRGAYPRALLGLLLLVSGVAAGTLGIWSYLEQSKAYDRLRDGRTAEARISTSEHDPSEDGPAYKVCYRYHVPVDGKDVRFESCEASSRREIESLHEQRRVEVVYSAADPRIATLKLRLMPPSPTWLLLSIVAGIGLLWAGVYLAVRNLLRARAHERLLQHGKRIDGVVFERWQERHDEGSPTDYVAFAFVAPSPGGSPVLVTIARANAGAYKKLQDGQRIVVLYLPASPQVCQLADFPD